MRTLIKRIIPQDEFLRTLFGILTPFFIIIALIMILVPKYLGSTVTEQKENISARVLTKSEVENFNLSGAVAGYLYGGFPFAIVGALAAADGCTIPIMIEGKAVTIPAPEKACMKLEANDYITIIRRVDTVTSNRTGRIIGSSVHYEWNK